MTDQPTETQPLKIIFAGTPDFAASHLQKLLDSRHQVIAVYTQPDRPAGRGKKLTASPVKQLALDNQLPVFQPESLKGEQPQAELAALNADLMIVVAYGLLLPKTVLDTPRLGCINVHASLLPRWRGAAPIQRAIEAGDKETGVTIMQMDVGLDTGDMLLKAHCQINRDDTAEALYSTLEQLGGNALLDTLELLAAGKQQPEKQNDSLNCYAPKLTKQEANLDWLLPAEQLHNRIRAFNSFPVTYSHLGEQRIRIWSAELAMATDSSQQPGTILGSSPDGMQVQCGEGQLLLKELQLPGKKRMPVAQVLNSRSELFAPGKRFS